MAETSDSLSTIADVTEAQYKYGFVTEIESEFAPKGLNEDIVRFISGKKDEPAWLLEWRLEAYKRNGSTMDEPDLGQGRRLSEDRLSRIAYYYAAPKSTDDAPKSLDEVDPEAARDLREARHSAARAGAGLSRASRSTRSSTASRSRRPSRTSCQRLGRHLLLDLRGGAARASRAGEEVPRLGRSRRRTTSSPR